MALLPPVIPSPLLTSGDCHSPFVIICVRILHELQIDNLSSSRFVHHCRRQH